MPGYDELFKRFVTDKEGTECEVYPDLFVYRWPIDQHAQDLIDNAIEDRERDADMTSVEALDPEVVLAKTQLRSYMRPYITKHHDYRYDESNSPTKARFDWFGEMQRNTKRRAAGVSDSNTKFALTEKHSMEGLEMLRSLNLKSMNMRKTVWVDGELVDATTNTAQQDLVRMIEALASSSETRATHMKPGPPIWKARSRSIASTRTTASCRCRSRRARPTETSAGRWTTIWRR
jgi:hypothetical protein